MFEDLLKDQDYGDVAEIIYLASRVISHRNLAPVENLLDTGSSSENALSQKRVAKKLIEEIEKKENTLLKNLDEVHSAEYIRLLSKMVQERAKSEHHFDKKGGSKLLKELRIFSEKKTHPV